MIDFEYAAPTTVKEAVRLLSEAKQPRLLAGGTDILVQLREGLRGADLVVDIKKIPDLVQATWTPAGSLIIGAGTPCSELYDDPKFCAAYAGVADAARIIGGWQIQSRASLGGNLCNSSPAADSIPALIAYGATAHIIGPAGIRVVPVEEFCTGPGKNVLQKGELLGSIELPAPVPRSGGHYRRFIPRNEMDIAVVGVGAWVQLDEGGKIAQARIGLGAVAPTPLLAKDAAASLIGQMPTEAAFEQAATKAQAIATPISDMRGPAEHRKHLVGVFTRRVLTEAVQRALGKSAHQPIPCV